MATGKDLVGHCCGIIMVPSWNLCEEMRQITKNIVRAASVPAKLQSGGTLNTSLQH